MVFCRALWEMQCRLQSLLTKNNETLSSSSLLPRKKRQKSSDYHDIFLIFAGELCKDSFAHIITC